MEEFRKPDTIAQQNEETVGLFELHEKAQEQWDEVVAALTEYRNGRGLKDGIDGPLDDYFALAQRYIDLFCYGSPLDQYTVPNAVQALRQIRNEGNHDGLEFTKSIEDYEISARFTDEKDTATLVKYTNGHVLKLVKMQHLIHGLNIYHYNSVRADINRILEDNLHYQVPESYTNHPDHSVTRKSGRLATYMISIAIAIPSSYCVVRTLFPSGILPKVSQQLR